MSAPPPAPHKSFNIGVFIALGAAAVCITVVAIVMSRGLPAGGGSADQQTTASEQQAQWESVNRDRLAGIKRAAEGLALEGNYREAHAKYVELDELVGGRTIQDGALAELASAARADQAKIYELMLRRMEEQTAEAEPAEPGPAEPAMPPEVRDQPSDAADANTAAPTSAPGDPPAVAMNVPEPAPPPPPTVVAPKDDHPAESNPPPASQPEFKITPGQVPRGAMSDADVGLSIQLGVDYLIEQFDEQGALRAQGEESPNLYQEGLNALCVYALASAERAIGDPRLNPRAERMDQMLEQLKMLELSGDRTTHAYATYARSLRACALATFNRPQDRAQLQDDVGWLMNANTGGAYTYDDRFAPPRAVRRPATRAVPPRSARPRSDAGARGAGPGLAAPGGDAEVFFAPASPSARRFLEPKRAPRWDNSNSQYGLLGVWAGADVGIEVPDTYWRLVQRHWSTCQLPNGQWGYSGGQERGSFAMTVAGVASLLVTHDYLEAPLMGGKRRFTREAYPPALEAGLAWVEEGDNSMQVESTWTGYNLFGLERVALASGFKQFGRHDWFIELGLDVLAGQNDDGSFFLTRDKRSKALDTAYALLFLSRGRHPVVMNKLRFDGFWTNRPREVSNLANFVGKELERPINWQVVDAARDAQDWADAPILFIASHLPPELDDAQVDKLRQYAQNGGLILTHADLGSEQFNTWAAELAKKLFPAYPLADLPSEHPIYTLNYTIKTPRPRLQGVSNGTRLLMVHAPTDIGMAWQVRAVVTRKDLFELGINLYLYTTGKQRFRNRLDTPMVPEPIGTPAHTLRLARLRYKGNWDPEPAAWPRAARKLQWEIGVRVEVVPTEAAALNSGQFDIAHLTGTQAHEPAPAEIEAMKQFVTAGGTLVVEAAGGSGAFADAENAWIGRVIGDAVKLEALPPGDGLLKKSVDGTVDVPTQALRLFAIEQLRSDRHRIKSARVGEGRVIFSGLDLSSGLLGTCTWGILGYLPEYSEAVARNLFLTTAASRAK